MASDAAQQLVDAIEKGLFDRELFAIRDAVNNRRHRLETTSPAKLYTHYPIGSQVKFNSRTTPKYLRGAIATVVSHNKSRGGKYDLEIELNYGVGKYPSGAKVRAMFEIVDPV